MPTCTFSETDIPDLAPGDRAFILGCDPTDDSLYRGPCGTGFWSFRAISDREAEFEWDQGDRRYVEDDDRAALDALEALPLPPWARRDVVEGGGPGSGYEAAVVVVNGGKSLHDLIDWLQKDAEVRARRVATRRRRRK